MLEIKNLSKTYKNRKKEGNKKAVDNLSITVSAGDIYGFIGHNGAGKTTVIKCITGILNFDDGEIIIDGHSIKDDPITCKKIFAYIPDKPDLYDFLTGIQYLNFIADVFEIPSKERTERIKKYADKFEITDSLGNVISSYSHGMKQKLTIIGALIHQPRLMILDEPFVGLDPKAARMLKETLREVCANGGAVFFSTHVLEVAEKLCNKISIIKAGKLVVEGDTQELTQNKSLEDVFMDVVNSEERV
ncbi:MAG TPA: ABC transporter ATP-binding protein [Methanocorpusculum sp.]|nr:ABC transporter ATP-binding protein [Methanocorpusculum sp.]